MTFHRQRLLAVMRTMPLCAAVALAVLAPGATAQVGCAADILELRHLLEAHQFARLDSALSARSRDAQADIRNETRYACAYDAFDTADSTLNPHFDAWVSSAPRSSRARLARGAHRITMAARARGSRVASGLDPTDDTVAWRKSNRPELLLSDRARSRSP